MKIFTKPWDGPLPVPKPDLKMKLTVFLFVVSLFQLHADIGYAQKTKITLDMQGVSILEVIEEIEELTDFDFLYREKALDLERKIHIKVRKKGIEDILRMLFKDSPVNYSIKNKLIILTKRGNAPTPDNVPAPKENRQQQFEVNGTVTDPEGNPLPGVNIIIKGTNQGTMSDPDGKYTIRVTANDILTFSYVGFKKVEMPVNGPETIDLQMQEDVMSLEGVEVNAGYWKVKDRERTGNISRLTTKEIANQPVANVMAAAIGRMPGVNIQQYNGLPGGNYRIRIRGQNSLRDDANEPLYVIDGVPYTSTSLATSLSDVIYGRGNSVSPLNAINPANIESIEILKDADATAIYGSRGANGVVLITTKKGSISKTMVDVNFQHGIGQVSHFMDLLNTQQYLEMRREAFANDGIDPRASDYDVNGAWDLNRDVDWQKRLLGGTAETTNAQLSISGGNQKTQYLFNGAYYRETTVLPGDFAYERASGLLNVNHTSENRRFKTNISVNFSKDENNLPKQDFTLQSLTLAPNAPEPFKEDGSLNLADGTWGLLGSPFGNLKRPYGSHTENLIINGIFNYLVLPGLELKSNLGYTTTKFNESVLNPISAEDPNSLFFTGTGSAQFTDNYLRTWIIEPQITFNRKVDKGVLNILVGSTFQKNILESQLIRASGIGNDALLENISAASSVIVSNSSSEYRYNAFFGRINYSWDGKYLLNLTGRRDGSSRFGPGKRFGNFWAVGGAWVFSTESFVRNSLSFLSFGKLRASYGTTGNDQIPDYGYLDTHGATSYLNRTALFPTRLVNQNYSWEVNKKFETGIELGFFKDRISLSTSYYRNRSSNQLVGFSLPAITGFTSVQANLPATIQNTGWELELTTRNIQSGELRWDTSVNLTIPKNKLIDYPNLDGSSYANRYIIGESLFIQKTYEYTGVDNQTGTYQFQDFDEDGIISSPNDIQHIVETGQKYYGGINNSINYKGLHLDFFFQIVRQTGSSYRNNFGPPGFLTSFGTVSNQPIEVMNRWKEYGDISDIQRFSATNSTISNLNSIWSNSSQGYQNASFVRLKNVSLSWDFPRELANKLKLQQLRIYIQGQNLLTLTDYKGLDPESSPSVLPPLRRIITGIKITL